MFKHSPDQAREAWVQALRSARYMQGRFHLRTDDRFCCLGVACDLFLKMEDQGEWDQSGHFIATPDDKGSSVLPNLVRNWLGLSSDFGSLVDNIKYGNDREGECLIALNDSGGYSFAAIADLIEAGKVRLA